MDKYKYYSDIIDIAVEGGINYWCDIVDYKNINNRLTVKINEEGTIRDISPTTVIKGIYKIVNDEDFQIDDDIRKEIYLASLTGGKSGIIDSTAADCIIQAALFNELKYG
jgi:hypothetical protein